MCKYTLDSTSELSNSPAVMFCFRAHAFFAQQIRVIECCFFYIPRTEKRFVTSSASTPAVAASPFSSAHSSGSGNSCDVKSSPSPPAKKGAGLAKTPLKGKHNSDRICVRNVRFFTLATMQLWASFLLIGVHYCWIHCKLRILRPQCLAGYSVGRSSVPTWSDFGDAIGF